VQGREQRTRSISLHARQGHACVQKKFWKERECHPLWARHTSTRLKPCTNLVSSIQKQPSSTPLRSISWLSWLQLITLAHCELVSDHSPFHSPWPCGLRMRSSCTRSPDICVTSRASTML